MRKIPDDLRKEMSEDPYYQKCCITGMGGKIEWHHNLIYAGKQVNEKWCILPLSKRIHDSIDYFKEKCNWIMVNRATDDELLKYSKVVDYVKMKESLNKRYGTPNLDNRA